MLGTERLRLRTLPIAARVLLTGFLLAMVAGFVAAQVNLRLQHADLDGEPGLSLEDVEIAFHGKPGSTLLTSKIAPGGSMARYIPLPADRARLDDWVAGGATRANFAPVAQTLDRLCVRCHNPGGEMAQVPFAPSRAEGAEFELVAPTTEPDRGISYASLARSSHAHLFGMSVLYLLAGGIFLLTDSGSRTKVVIAALPFVAMFLDIGCWWLTKLHAGFAPGIVAGGALLGVSFAVLTLRPLWELWTAARSPSDA
jgi:uncharacterized membrane protein